MRVLTVYAHPNPKSFCHAVLDRLAGLAEGGHSCEVVDLYAIKFDPVFRQADYSFFAHESVPLFDEAELREGMIAESGGPIRRRVARRWLRNKPLPELLEIVAKQRPRTCWPSRRRSPLPTASRSSPALRADDRVRGRDRASPLGAVRARMG